MALEKRDKNKMIEINAKNILKFLGLWFLIFSISFIILSIFDLVPESKDEIVFDIASTTQTLEQKVSLLERALPERIVINTIGVDVAINNPNSRNIDILNESLKSGSVRYPDSGLLGERTNMLLFGHSSNLPIVRNGNYKAFNKLDELKIEDRVSVFSNTHEFIYEVTSVEEADASDAFVNFESNKRELTLSTCDNFGDLNDRFVVRAELVDVKLASRF